MSLQSLIGLFLKFSIISRMIKLVAGCLLGMAVLGWVVDHCGSRNNEVIVHVMEPDVEVTFGDQTYQIKGRRYDPIVCDLSPGWHRLIMRRGDRILFEESFEVRPGQNVVRTAWNPEHSRAASAAGPCPGPGPSRGFFP
jgi:hypothetical protein